ncbi:MAG: methyltransferase regulatory domain-containing protein [Planctomycetaceae bacterium]|nr:methyltransferase regulatory domain-containing protein [Planctomycetaceae bacterium]
MSSYNDVPYPSMPVRGSHPDRLHAVASLCGLSPAPVDACRVLELGSSDGGNLVPLAEALPNSTFLGLDNSSRQIDDGREIVRELGLTNIRLECRDLIEPTPDLGEFDYIICHGVYSWVPPPVQERILQICGAHLAPHGVAFVSYNTQPGWHLRGMVREMMLYHVAEFADPQDRISQSQAFLDFMVRFAPNPDKAYARLLRDEMERLRDRPRTYLFHEHLEDCNQPIYFHEFMSRASAAGLQYLSDDTLPSAWNTQIHADAVQLLAGLGDDVIRREQYLDFLQGCAFRRTLLCPAAANISRVPDAEVLRRGYLSAALKPSTPIEDLASNDVVEFRTPDGPTADMSGPIVKAAAVILGEQWPRSLHFHELLQQAAEKLRGTAEAQPQDESLLFGDMLKCVAAGLVDFRLSPDRFVSRVSDRPRTTRGALRSSARGEAATSLVHSPVGLNPVHRQVLRRLDGRHDVQALLAALEQDVRNGDLKIEANDGAANDEQSQRSALGTMLHDALRQFVRLALLVE